MTTFDFSGKTAIVTGGASGIGQAIAQALATAGATIHMFDITGNPPVDVSVPASLEAAFESVPDPDIVIVNAGIGSDAELTSTSHEHWQRTIDINLTGAFHTVRLAAARMKPRRKGAIVVTASTNSYDGEPLLTAYNASKAGLLGIVHTAAGELGPYGIRINAVCPGLIRTPLTRSRFSDRAFMKDYFRAIPLGRGGDPVEVASAALFLASDAASYVTGATLLVDGGQLATKFGTWHDASAEFVEDHWTLRET
jgi:NAD(P)-dependent dehydrogenase (short-subunit alcohol dehydrogenase family)